MNASERRAFLLEGTRTGKLSTTRRDGRPLVTPIWFVLDGDDVVFTTHETSGKARGIRRDPRVCLCIDDQRPPYSYVIIDGEATLSNDVDELRTWATRIGGRYMGGDRAAEYGARNGVPGELVVRVVPVRVVSEAGVAD